MSIYEDYPQFAKVEDIYVADGKIVFEVKLELYNYISFSIVEPPLPQMYLFSSSSYDSEGL